MSLRLLESRANRQHEGIKALALRRCLLSCAARILKVGPSAVTVVSTGGRRSRRIEAAIAEAVGSTPQKPWPELRSMAFVARELFINVESLVHLRKAGFFGAHRPQQQGIHYQHLEAFKKEYVSSTELARRLGMNPKSVTCALRELGFSPIHEVHPHKRLQSCWRRTEVEDLDWRNMCVGQREGRGSSRTRVAQLISLGARTKRCAEEIGLASAVQQLGTNVRSALEAAKRGYLVVARRAPSGRVG